MWKQCVSGSYDFVNEKDNTIIQIYRVKNKKNRMWNGQVMHPNGVHSTLINHEDYNLFILKCCSEASSLGWGIDMGEVGVNPNLENLPSFESDLYKEYIKETKYDRPTIEA